MTTPPNLQKLIITGKGGPDTISGKDGRIVEMWANEGIVRSLHAGSGITLDPADGVDMGNGIEISSSGGGSGTSVGQFYTILGPDLNAANVMYFGGGDVTFAPFAQGWLMPTTMVTSDPNPGGNIYPGYGWWVQVGAGQVALSWPFVQAPPFASGGPLVIPAGSVYIGVSDLSGTNALTKAGPVADVDLTTTASYQFNDTDFTTTIYSHGTITVVHGTGGINSGEGFLPPGAGFYFGFVAMRVDTNGAVFT